MTSETRFEITGPLLPPFSNFFIRKGVQFFKWELQRSHCGPAVLKNDVVVLCGESSCPKMAMPGNRNGGAKHNLGDHEVTGAPHAPIDFFPLLPSFSYFQMNPDAAPSRIQDRNTCLQQYHLEPIAVQSCSLSFLFHPALTYRKENAPSSPIGQKGRCLRTISKQSVRLETSSQQ